jgi:predicted nucleotidyltransferase
MSSDEAFVAEVLRALEEAKLEALIVGMVAAVIQGAPVTTRDLDLLIRDTPRNREKLEHFARVLGAARPAPVADLTNTLRVSGADIPIDVMLDGLAGGLSFGALRSRAQRLEIAGQIALVASLEDVIASKEAAGRPKDIAQLPILRDTLRVRKALAGKDQP